MSELGQYIVIEGTDGAGKSTVADLLAEKFRQDGREVLRLDEPDSAKDVNQREIVPISSEIGKIVRNGNLARVALTDFYLFHASRIANWELASRPALENGIDVISARNYWSTIAYQGYGSGVDVDKIEELTFNDLGTRYTKPGHAYILDLDDEEERQRRIGGRGDLAVPDRFESEGLSFQEKVIEGYRTIGKEKGIDIIPTDNIDPQQLCLKIYRDIVERDVTTHLFWD